LIGRSPQKVADAIKAAAKEEPFHDWELGSFDGLAVHGPPNMVLEGTNYSDPLCAAITCYTGTRDAANVIADLDSRMRRAETNYRALGQFAIMAKHPSQGDLGVYDRDESGFNSFYRRPVAIWSEVPVREWGLDAADFTIGYGTQTEGTHKDGYAVDFRDWVGMSTRITIRPLFTMTPRDLEICDEARSHRHPCFIPYVPEKGVSEIILPLKSRIRGILDELADKYPRKSLGKMTTDVCPSFHSYKCNHVSKLTDARLNAIREALRAGFFTGFDYEIVPLTSDGELYIVDLRLYP
jgi:hypothetical protein